jgi:hypothetical protein
MQRLEEKYFAPVGGRILTIITIFRHHTDWDTPVPDFFYLSRFYLRFSWQWWWCSESWCCVDLYVGRYWCFGVTCWSWRQYISPKFWYLHLNEHIVTAQKNSNIRFCLFMSFIMPFCFHQPTTWNIIT